MIFKNTFRLLFTNFNLTYKVFFYKLIIFLISFGISFAIGSQFYIALGNQGFYSSVISELTAVFTNFGPLQVFTCLNNCFYLVLNMFAGLTATQTTLGIISLSVLFVLFYVLGSFSNLASLDCINANMSSKTKISFFKSLIAKIGKSVPFALIRFVVLLPFVALTFAVLYFGFEFYNTISVDALKMLIPFVMFILISVVMGIYLTIITGFGASIIINNKGTIKGFKLGLVATNKKGLRVFSNALFISIILIIFNLCVGLFTFFGGLVITLPISYVVLRLFNSVTFYETMGMRYYISEEIRSPIRLEEQDKIKDLKFVI